MLPSALFYTSDAARAYLIDAPHSPVWHLG
jgi:hypothetical protein